jgi:hypothetical protein
LLLISRVCGLADLAVRLAPPLALSDQLNALYWENNEARGRGRGVRPPPFLPRVLVQEL